VPGRTYTATDHFFLLITYYWSLITFFTFGGNMFEPFHEIINNVSDTILKYEREQDRPVIGVMPAYFPMELIDAAGGYAVQLWGNNLPLAKADGYLQSYCCSVARSVLELELLGIAKMVKAYAFTSLCDTLINLREIYRRLFPKPTLELSIPITATLDARQTYLKSVIHKVFQDLEAITGQPITPETLAWAAKVRGRSRALQRRLYEIRRKNPGAIKNHDFYAAIKAAFFLPPPVYNNMIQGLVNQLEGLPQATARGPLIVLSGMVFDPMEIHRVMDESGVNVVDDDFANGWRTVSKADLSVGNVLEGVTEYLFNPAPCCCIYHPDLDRHPYLVAKAKETGAAGVIFWYVKFCEPDAFDRPQLIRRLKEENVPATTIEVELSMTNMDAIKTRISAFCEILED
jgi:bcr-type benzoyl-CoA reductase subunit C